tara:strand:- start:50 stop:715 length:666 start_codon:yes stop_codon:yes gene_type:complete
MCNPYAYGALLIAQGYAQYQAQQDAYDKGQKLAEENKELASDAYDLDIAQINKRQEEEEESFELSQRQLEKKDIQEGVDAVASKRAIEKEVEKDKGKVVGKLTAGMLSGNTVDAIIADFDQQMLTRTGEVDLNRDRSRQMIAEQRGINTRNLAFATDQLQIGKKQAYTKYQDRVFSYQTPGKPDPLTALLGAGSAGFQSYQYGKDMDYNYESQGVFGWGSA